MYKRVFSPISAGAVCCLALFSAPSQATDVPPPVPAPFCVPGTTMVIDAEYGTTFAALPLGNVSVAWTGGAYPAHQALAKVDLKGCKVAHIVAEYERGSSGWTLNIGDSPTNDGYGGDAGTSLNDAEIQVLGSNMTVYTSEATAPTEAIARQDFQLTQGALKFMVGHQFLSWGNPYGVLNTPISKRLFSQPDAADGSMFYIGLNRVVSGPGTRVGSGLVRIMLSFD